MTESADFISESSENMPDRAQGCYPFLPVCQLDETERSYRIRIGIGDYTLENVEIELSTDRLVVSGSPVLRLEGQTVWKGASFQREFALPAAADPKKIEAFYQERELHIVTSKTPTSLSPSLALAASVYYRPNLH